MRLAFALLTIAVTPALLGAQQAGTSTTAGASADVHSATASAVLTGNAAADARIRNALVRVETEGIGTHSLRDRVRLGRARGVPAARIAAAVEHRADAIIDARNALRVSAAASSAVLVELGADAIESGADASAVAAVAAGFEVEERGRALSALAALATEGRIGADVVAAVRDALDAGFGASGSAAAVVGGASPAGVGVARGASASVTATVGAASVPASADTGAAGAVRGVLPR